MKTLKDSTLIIAGIVRNAEYGLIRNIPIIDSLCHKCLDYRIVIYENDSIDKTKLLLKKWQSEDPKRIHILLDDMNSSNVIPCKKEVTGNPFFSYKRIHKMVVLRNQYMDYIERQKWNADYLIVVDLDVAKLYLNGILMSFTNNIEWDAVTAFGYSTSPRLKRRYHDTYALTEYGDEKNPQTEMKIKKLANKYGKLKPSDKWIRVFSAFGGLSIYRFKSIIGLHYKVIENDDKKVEVYCEHYSLYYQMAERGFNHVYINPAMTLKYQRLTWPIIWNSLYRKICQFLLYCHQRFLI